MSNPVTAHRMRLPARLATAVALGASLVAGAARAQTTPPASIPSPEIDNITTVNGGLVTFRIFAPNAHQVSVSYGNTGLGITPPLYPMTKNSAGTWTLQTVLAPNVYEYFFDIDGFRSIDTGAANTLQKPQREVQTSLLDVPGTIYDTYRVPHGQVRAVSYYSKSLKEQRQMLVYTPPGYDASTAKRYPVLYFYHGGGDTIYSWYLEGRGPEILDNLQASGTTVPMILVMPDTQTNEPLLEASTDPNAVSENAATADTELVSDIVPYVDSHFRTIANGANRAISGLSLGGIQALVSGIGHIGTFDWIISLSGGPLPGFTSTVLTAGLKQAALANATLRELVLAAGGSGDIALANTIAFQHTLQQDGFNSALFTPPGYAHEFNFWRNAFVAYTPTLFR